MREKVLYGLFFIAVMLFVAKPFIAFSIAGKTDHITASNILIKSLDKRKPEDLHDAENNKAAIHHMLIDPPLKLVASISLLLAFIFPLLFNPGKRISNGFLSNINYSLVPAGQTYLLAGKLTI